MLPVLPPKSKTRSILSAIMLALFGLLGGCSQRGGSSERKINRNPNLLVVYCACSLVPEIELARDEFIAANSGKSMDLVADEPANLVRRVEDGAVPDLFICPGEAEIGTLQAEGLLDGSSRQAWGALRVAIFAPRGNPSGVHAAQDLSADRVRVIGIPTPGLTSPGTEAKRVLERAGLWSKLQSKLSFQGGALAALRAVSKGEVDAALLFEPCLRLSVAENDIPAGSVERVASIGGEEDRGTRVYALTHKQSPNALLAQRFLRYVMQQEEGGGDTTVQPGPPTEGEAPPAG